LAIQLLRRLLKMLLFLVAVVINVDSQIDGAEAELFQLSAQAAAQSQKKRW
jgi:hypothetical protein